MQYFHESAASARGIPFDRFDDIWGRIFAMRSHLRRRAARRLLELAARDDHRRCRRRRALILRELVRQDCSFSGPVEPGHRDLAYKLERADGWFAQ